MIWPWPISVASSSAISPHSAFTAIILNVPSPKIPQCSICTSYGVALLVFHVSGCGHALAVQVDYKPLEDRSLSNASLSLPSG